MKKLSYLLLSGALILVTLSSCKRDLELQPLDQYADEAVWNGNDPALIEAFVNNLYRGLGQSGIRVQLSTYVDETMLTFGWETQNVTQSLINPSDYSRFNVIADQSGNFVWENVYKNIRACNLFFEKIETATAADTTQKQRYKGEVHFLRAYYYHMLLSVYGGVPVITKTYGLNEDYNVARNTFEETVRFITDECNKAVQLLTTTQKGRASKGAALALKARVLTYAASDLYNKGAAWAGTYSHPQLIGYVGGDRNLRWQAAKDAAKAVMDLNIYDIYKKNPVQGEDIAKNYGEVFLLKQTPEDIFVKYTLNSMNTTLVMPNLNNGPNGYHLRGANTPLGQLVDAYEMSDGTRFSWNNPAHAAKPYENREPRFYASILYDGAKWRERPLDVRSIDPVGIIQTSKRERWNATTNKIDVVSGLDTRQSPTDDWNGSYTGYYIRKGIDPSIDAQYVNQETPWRFIRYTEVILNYAEACLGLGQEEEARTYINIIRKRAGLPPANESGQALISRYQNERRIELALEDHRFFDVRRWMIAPQAYDNAQGINILHKLNADKVTTTATYSVIASVQRRAWKDQFYFLPIKLAEMNRNKNLVQNPIYK